MVLAKDSGRVAGCARYSGNDVIVKAMSSAVYLYIRNTPLKVMGVSRSRNRGTEIAILHSERKVFIKFMW